MQLIIGTYTEHLPHVNGKADGILTAGFDPGCGAIGPVATAARARNPSYLTVSPDGRRLYAVIEAGSFAGQEGSGGVAAYARDPAGGLTLLNAAATGGPDPCFVALDRTGRFVLVANYGAEAGSVAAWEVGPDGELGPLASHVRHHGSGPHPGRQAGPHAHMIASDPVTGAVLATDLGADAIVAYALDAAGHLEPHAAGRLAAAPGAGPRHLAFHPGGEYLFVACELDNTIVALRRAGRGWALAGQVSTRPPGASGPSLAAAVRVTPSGRHVLASNRGDDTIAVYRFAAGAPGPALSPLGHVAAPGAAPRDLIVSPDGRHVLVACQDGDVLASYPFDDAAGTLGEPRCVAAPTPACLALAPAGE
ncbi:MAG TPA: lactonase family protein [Trebonia sp.]|jgi:6-phosphogluconolactonase|nr:lactonase family protein [Trebonia sp.]